MQPAEQLRALMSFAHIVDLDFSEWDDRIALLALDISQPAEAEVQQGIRRFLPLYEVNLIGLRKIEFRFKHVLAKSSLSKDQHIQWTVMDCEVTQREGGLSLTTRSWGAEPEFACEFSSVEIKEVDVEDALLVAPWWGQRESPPFLRPGLVGVARLLRGR